MSASFVLLRHKAEAASAQARANAPLAGPGAFLMEAAAFAAICESARPDAPRDACVMPSLQTRQAAPGPAAQKFEHKNTRVSSAHNSDAMAMASRAAHLKLSCEQSAGSLTLKAPFRRRLKIFSAYYFGQTPPLRAWASNVEEVCSIVAVQSSKHARAAPMASSFRTRATRRRLLLLEPHVSKFGIASRLVGPGQRCLDHNSGASRSIVGSSSTIDASAARGGRGVLRYIVNAGRLARRLRDGGGARRNASAARVPLLGRPPFFMRSDARARASCSVALMRTLCAAAPAPARVPLSDASYCALLAAGDAPPARWSPGSARGLPRVFEARSTASRGG